MAGAAAANGEACAPGAGSPCGACKFLRRRCVPDCVFAPYFSNDQGAARFAAIHRVFGASNASKLLSHLPVADRGEAVVTIAYEAQARLRDPVYGCVAQIFALQQQVAILQAQLTQAKAQLACGGGVQQGGSAHSPVSHHQWSDNSIGSLLRQDNSCFPSPADFRGDVFATQHCARADAGDLQYLAQAMARCHNHSM